MLYSIKCLTGTSENQDIVLKNSQFIALLKNKKVCFLKTVKCFKKLKADVNKDMTIEYKKNDNQLKKNLKCAITRYI